MNHNDTILSRNNSQILRGVAILFIMLHNFLHFEQWGFTGENEGSYSSIKASDFYNAIMGGSSIVGEFLSHLGWIGVPVFIFLTGYGVVHTPPLSIGVLYLKRNYIKLLALLFPALLFFTGIDILRGDLWPVLLKRASYLTMLVNFAYPFVRCSPGVYWYFGLTFQFYLLWVLFGRFFNGKNLLICSVLSLIGLYVLCLFDLPNLLSIYKACFTGWFPVFAIGVWIGSNTKKTFITKTSLGFEIFLFIVLLGLVLLMGKWLISWLFVPIVALLWFIVIGIMLMRTHYLSSVFRWLGSISACIFVCHPIARFVINHFVYYRFSINNIIICVSLYCALTLVLALPYSVLYKWLLSRFLPKTT